MEKKRNKNWLFLAISGVISILFGVLLVFFTWEIIKTVILYLGVVLLVTGIVLFIVAINQMKKDKNVTMMIIQSVAAIAIGLVMLIFREKTITFFLITIGVWTLVVGVFQLVILINIPKTLRGKNMLLFNGILTMALGVFLILKPMEFAEVMVIVVGVLAMIFGLGMIALAFLIRNVAMVKPGEEVEAKV